MKRATRSLWETFDSEDSYTISTIDGWNKQEPHGIICCHGYNGKATDVTLNAPTGRLLSNLGRISVARFQDWAGNNWGNDSAMTKIDTAIASLRSKWGVAGKISLMGISMGGSTVLNYAVRHQTDIQSIALAISLTDLQATYDAGPYKTSIETAFGGTFNSTINSERSPIEFVTDIPDSIPIGLWTSTNDPIALPAWHTAFVAACPPGRIEQSFMGPVGHALSGQAIIDIPNWIKSKY